MARVRIALFTSSSNFGGRALEELAGAHDVVAVVRPARPGMGDVLRRAAGLDGPAPLESRARAMGIPVITARELGAETRERVHAHRPDLICIALFPRRVPAGIAGLAPLGAINVHPSLLPRHRGPLPLFWTYHANDRLAGVTVHHATDRYDAGDIVLQESFELPRGYPVARLDRDVAERGARMLRDAAAAMADGTASRTPQDDSLATQAPVVRRGAPMARFEEWDVERVWHFLAGLCPPYREPLADERGHRVEYQRVVGYRVVATTLPPGRVQRDGERMLLHCREGIVELA